MMVDDYPIGALFCSGGSQGLKEDKLAEVGEELKRVATLYSRGSPNLRLLAQLLGANGT